MSFFLAFLAWVSSAHSIRVSFLLSSALFFLTVAFSSVPVPSSCHLNIHLARSLSCPILSCPILSSHPVVVSLAPRLRIVHNLNLFPLFHPYASILTTLTSSVPSQPHSHPTLSYLYIPFLTSFLHWFLGPSCLVDLAWLFFLDPPGSLLGIPPQYYLPPSNVDVHKNKYPQWIGLLLLLFWLFFHTIFRNVQYNSLPCLMNSRKYCNFDPHEHTLDLIAFQVAAASDLT